MAEVSWTPEAADDFESITEFIAKDSSQYAQLFALDVLETVEHLEEFPAMGRLVPELNDPVVREILFGSYRIIYRLQGGLVEILTIYQGARLLDPKRLK